MKRCDSGRVIGGGRGLGVWVRGSKGVINDCVKVGQRGVWRRGEREGVYVMSL